jgi:hypothetical protein
MLPKNMTMSEASRGFKNQGQFIAALHVSQNLGIPFRKLRTEMVKNDQSLGQSIKTLRPSANSSTETAHAQRQATLDLLNTETPTTSGTTATTGTTPTTTTGTTATTAGK